MITTVIITLDILSMSFIVVRTILFSKKYVDNFYKIIFVQIYFIYYKCKCEEFAKNGYQAVKIKNKSDACSVALIWNYLFILSQFLCFFLRNYVSLQYIYIRMMQYVP